MNRTKIIRGLVYFFILAVFVNTALFLSTDAAKNKEAFARFSWALVPGVLALVLVNFTLREVKWNFFRQRAGIEAPRKASWLIFFSGYSMCISPGRFGEIIKPVLYKEYYKTPLKKALPLVFCERLTDLLGMVIMCLATIAFYIQSFQAGAVGASASAWTMDKVVAFFVLSIGLLAGLIGLARWRPFALAVLDKLAASKLEGPAEKLRHLYEETYQLLTFFNLGTMSLFAAFSWFFECLAMYLICYGLGIADIAGGPVGLHHCAFIFCVSSILGALTFIFPGGMGPVELLMSFLIASLGVAAADANAAMFLTRFCTLIFGAALGFFFLGVTARYHRDSDVWTHMTEAVENPSGEQKGIDEDGEEPSEEPAKA